MVRTLREWSPPGATFKVRFNPDRNEFELQQGWTWLVWRPTARYALDHAAALDALRASPYAPEPKGLREQIDNILRNMFVYRDDVIDDLLAVIDRERPALDKVPEDALVAELVRRCGWAERHDLRQSCYRGDENHLAVSNAGEHRRVLIAPRAAR